MVLNKQALILENVLLRQQLIILNRQVKRPQFRGRERALIVMLSSRLANWKQALLIIKPDTVLRWHCDLFRLVWRHRSRVKSIRGRHRLGSDQVALIRRLAAENISWGTERIRGELLKLGFPSAKSTIQHYLKHRRAVKPGNQTWHTFLCNHASEIWACDFRPAQGTQYDNFTLEMSPFEDGLQLDCHNSPWLFLRLAADSIQPFRFLRQSQFEGSCKNPLIVLSVEG